MPHQIEYKKYLQDEVWLCNMRNDNKVMCGFEVYISASITQSELNALRARK